VVVYDQVGTGRSSRLPRPSGYTRRRAVDDLAEVVDHVRAVTGHDSVTLLGYSWGATISMLYAAERPGRVTGLATMSPGALPIRGGVQRVSGPQSRLGLLDRVHLYLVALRPRNIFLFALTQVDPDTAHQLADDPEADARYAELYRISGVGLSCDESRPVEVPSGLGHFANAVPVADRGGPTLDPAAVGRLRHQPVIVLRGECDYLKREDALSYPRHLPEAQFIHVESAGHALLVDQPRIVTTHLRAFLGSLE
jgi:pimeloyl-ACP methyl ester carboxylesterase